MRLFRLVLVFLLSLAWFLPSQAQNTRMYNTVKTKLAEGKQVVGGTVDTPDPDIYCAMANSGFDFIRPNKVN